MIHQAAIPQPLPEVPTEAKETFEEAESEKVAVSEVGKWLSSEIIGLADLYYQIRTP